MEWLLGTTTNGAIERILSLIIRPVNHYTIEGAAVKLVGSQLVIHKIQNKLHFRNSNWPSVGECRQNPWGSLLFNETWSKFLIE